MTEDPFSLLAARSPAHRAQAVRGLYREELVADFTAQTGFVQYRNGKVPRFRSLDVEVAGREVVIRGTLAVWDLFSKSWVPMGKRATVEKRITDEAVVRALAATEVPPGAEPVVPEGSATAGAHPLALVLLALIVALGVLAMLLYGE